MQSTCISRSSTTYRTSDTIARKMDNAPALMEFKVWWETGC